MEAPNLLNESSYDLAVPVTLRYARADDLPKLEWYGQYAHFRAVFRRTLHEQQEGRRLMLVADSSGFPIGQLFVHFHELQAGGLFARTEKYRRAYFYSLRVMEMFRGLGLGTQMLATAERIARESDCTLATISAAKDNLRARRLYERLGYRIVSEDEGNWSYTDQHGRVRYVHEPCWVLEKVLAIR